MEYGERCACIRCPQMVWSLYIAVLQIAVGHRTFPDHNKRLSEYFILCSVIFSDSMFELI